jgi:hypothetical protein
MSHVPRGWSTRRWLFVCSGCPRLRRLWSSLKFVWFYLARSSSTSVLTTSQICSLALCVCVCMCVCVRASHVTLQCLDNQNAKNVCLNRCDVSVVYASVFSARSRNLVVWNTASIRVKSHDLACIYAIPLCMCVLVSSHKCAIRHYS